MFTPMLRVEGHRQNIFCVKYDGMQIDNSQQTSQYWIFDWDRRGNPQTFVRSAQGKWEMYVLNVEVVLL